MCKSSILEFESEETQQRWPKDTKYLNKIFPAKNWFKTSNAILNTQTEFIN